ncbi:ImmA/IrrE family metallo-endopeptidase [Stenotrophomonas maltophilia]|uniref:ImmA/IrrE family metallo-endopeptidase n=1 Tax=Stenotrophomonas maltophilia TaxID=40324 RepID=UPI0015DEAC8B|nr:ImmA/IrrE family metallo-endopeptidase [Stenotrophomonas maltophilia]MBA0281525.1 ImmA/IrrE family metallo-endopeptidase [Stenotrophomonas maltophilia]MBA0344946.1 ImmA/IrrE family metallo-endopeptidase [Stenotrophomonas maltophilia]MBA0358275.1 ImmA/IrrE family metallo-endopeptidase [Stenotrophomonas maltophilia]MBA0520163.1 ImmA/IrrE family metallo-endopeptidase [Stenotrophomonas maltophilia]
MDAKVIRTEDQYLAYMHEVQRLVSLQPSVGTVASDRLELLTVLVENYENSKFPIESPDPIDAIVFRMQEKGLKQTDLVPYFGTRSRVSEVLARKRPLTVQMIRALSLGLGISAETLVGLSVSEDQGAASKSGADWSRFPLKEMTRRGWLADLTAKTKSDVEELVRGFIEDAGLQFGAAAFRRSIGGEAASPTTKYALHAWLARIIQRARGNRSKLGPFERERMSAGFLRELAQLSWSEHGPLLAVEFLERHGIAVVIEPQLKGTSLDGAALKDADGTPIVGLTLRYDRLDNFWFTLLHEVAHVWKHIDDNEAFLDNLDASSEDKREAEANRLAREAFIPRVLWRRSEAFLSPSRESIEKLARELRIHPAIIAGRLRKDSNNYTLFSDLVGQQNVRSFFLSSDEV